MFQGPDKLVSRLRGQTFVANTGNSRLVVRLFQSVRQQGPGRWDADCGVWGGSAENFNGGWVVENGGLTLETVYTNGNPAGCPYGRKRQTRVTLQCGAQSRVSAVHEGPACVYHVTITTKAACDVDRTYQVPSYTHRVLGGGPTKISQALSGFSYEVAGWLNGRPWCSVRQSLFGDATQPCSRITTGRWRSPDGVQLGGWIVRGQRYAEQFYPAGDTRWCPGGAGRSTVVTYKCGSTRRAEAYAREAPVCQYNVNFVAPEVCTADLRVVAPRASPSASPTRAAKASRSPAKPSAAAAGAKIGAKASAGAAAATHGANSALRRASGSPAAAASVTASTSASASVTQSATASASATHSAGVSPSVSPAPPSPSATHSADPSRSVAPSPLVTYVYVKATPTRTASQPLPLFERRIIQREVEVYGVSRSPDPTPKASPSPPMNGGPFDPSEPSPSASGSPQPATPSPTASHSKAAAPTVLLLGPGGSPVPAATALGPPLGRVSRKGDCASRQETVETAVREAAQAVDTAERAYDAVKLQYDMLLKAGNAGNAASLLPMMEGRRLAVATSRDIQRRAKTAAMQAKIECAAAAAAAATPAATAAAPVPTAGGVPTAAAVSPATAAVSKPVAA